MVIKNNKLESREKLTERNFLFPNSNRSQITIFIILSLVIVVIIALIFIGRDRIAPIFQEEPPINQIRRCAEDSIKNITKLVGLQGGSVSPDLYYLYEGNKVAYICYTEEDYKGCVMQKPLLKQSVEKEIETYSKAKIENCVENVKASLQKRNYEVSSKRPNITIEIVPDNIIISINDADLIIKKDRTETYKNIKTELSSKLYELIMVASSISNWEARYGDSESVSYMLYYPKIKLEKKKQSDGTTIYNLTERDTGERFIFAAKSFSVPSGITGE